MSTKKKPTVETIENTARVVSIDSVLDWQLTKIEGYLTDEPINDTSKLIRHQDDGMEAVNKFFTRKQWQYRVKNLQKQ